MIEDNPDTSLMDRALGEYRSIGDYARLIERHKWLILTLTGATFAVSLFLSLQQTTVYRGTAQVLLNRRDVAAAVAGAPADPTLGEDPARFAATQAALARSSAVSRLTLQNTGQSRRPVGDFLAHSSVQPSPSADVLTFTADAGDAVKAAALANAYAHAFAAYALSSETNSIQTARAELDARIAALKASGQQQTALYRDLVNSEQQLHTIQLLQAAPTVLSTTGKGVQVQPTPKRNGLLGAGFGLLLGLAMAFIADALDKRIKSEEEIERLLGLTLLARIPAPSRALRESRQLTMLAEPMSAHAESIRRLATNIEFASTGSSPQVIMVTSSVSREGKSTTAGDLAVALALTGKNVALLDVDLRRPVLASMFGIRGERGLTNVMLGRAPLEQALVPVQFKPPPVVAAENGGERRNVKHGSLMLLPTGPLPPSPSEFLGGGVIASRVIEPLRARFDYILLDVPPMGIVSDAAKLTPHVDALLVIARLNVVERPALHDFKRELSTFPATPLGLVLTGVPAVNEYAESGYFMDDTSPDDDGTAHELTRARSARRRPS